MALIGTGGRKIVQRDPMFNHEDVMVFKAANRVRKNALSYATRARRNLTQRGTVRGDRGDRMTYPNGGLYKASGLTREALYKALRPDAKPRYDTIAKVCGVLEVRLAAQALHV
jgi:hypothetical protein